MTDTARPRLLLVTQDFPPRPGGLARYYADLATGWGTGFTVMSGAWNGDLAPPSGDETVLRMTRVDARSGHRPVNVSRARRQIRARVRFERPAVMLAGNIRPYALVVRRIARSEGLPWGYFVHGSDLLTTARRWKSNPIKRLRWARLLEPGIIVSNSRFTAGEAERLGMPAGRIVVARPEVDATRFHPPRDRRVVVEERRRLGLPVDGLLTLFVGRLVERKGLGDLFAAMAINSHARLVVIGVGAFEPWRLEAMKAGVADRVYFGGSPDPDELPSWYRAADLFAAPSRHSKEQNEVEGFGIVLLEAQASGLPVLTTRAGGIPEAVDEGTTALLVEPENIPSLAAAWDRLLSDEPLRRRMAAAAPAGPPRRFVPGSSAAALATGIADLLRTPARS